jgi:ArsR family transcriptional regulator, virulence genes transcriptional regulator
MLTNNFGLDDPNPPENVLKIDSLAIKKASLILRSINHKLRQSILKLLAENKNLTVTDIYVKLRLEQSVASQHLAILRKGGMVTTIRDGKNIFYSVNSKTIDYMQIMVKNLNEFIDV